MPGLKAFTDRMGGEIKNISTTDSFLPPKTITVTASNTYRLYNKSGEYIPAYLYKGLVYDEYRDVVKITDSAGSALAAGLVYIQY